MRKWFIDRRIIDLRDDTKGVILHDGRATHTSKKSLLHPALESQNGDLRRWLDMVLNCSSRAMGLTKPTHQFNIHVDFTSTDPRKNDAENDKISGLS